MDREGTGRRKTEIESSGRHSRGPLDRQRRCSSLSSRQGTGRRAVLGGVRGRAGAARAGGVRIRSDGRYTRRERLTKKTGVGT